MFFLWESSLGCFHPRCRPFRFPGDCFLHSHSILQKPSWSRPDPDDSFTHCWTLSFGVFPTNSYVCGWWWWCSIHKLQLQCLVATSKEQSRCIVLTENISNATLLLVCIHVACFWASFCQNGSTEQFRSGFWSVWYSVFHDATAKHVHVAAHGEHREGGLCNDPPTQKIREKSLTEQWCESYHPSKQTISLSD